MKNNGKITISPIEAYVTDYFSMWTKQIESDTVKT